MAYALIDYDNLHPLIQQRGLSSLVMELLLRAQASSLGTPPELVLRLYGGWFDNLTATRRSISLAAECAALPQSQQIATANKPIAVRVRGELALTLLDEPKVVLTHTVREYAPPGSLRGATTAIPGCAEKSTCPIPALAALVNSKKCSSAKCKTPLSDVLWRDEQKMVDTMLVTDLASLQRRGEPAALVVSTDDDMWPGIRSALVNGMRIEHFHPQPRRSTPTHYLVSMPTGYAQHTIS